MWKDKQLIIFDLDDTLTEPKIEMKEEMAQALSDLLRKKKVAIISGSFFNQFEKQFISVLQKVEAHFPNLFLFPTCGAAFYRFSDTWENVYMNVLSEEEKKKIYNAFDRALGEAGFIPLANPFGEIIEDRGSQLTFSAFGQQAPLSMKKVWDPRGEKRLHIKSFLDKLLPEFEVKIGGSTSIDVTRKGIDKGYGIDQMEKHLGVPRQSMLFIGDALFPGGNDYPVKEKGVDTIEVGGPAHTIKIIREVF